MALGELYKPTGKALDTAQAVLQVENVMACNVAIGCTNKCDYCWLQVPPFSQVPGEIRFPKKPAPVLVYEQLQKIPKPDGVFLCFMTDPLLDVNYVNTEEVIGILLDAGIKVAVLSKVSISSAWDHVLNGMTVVSLDEDFAREHEPNAPSINQRIGLLRGIKDLGGFVWFSIEPYPTPNIHPQELLPLLQRLSFADLLVFGKWNYDARAKGKAAVSLYREVVEVFESYCKNSGIRYFVKPDTLKFIGR